MFVWMHPRLRPVKLTAFCLYGLYSYFQVFNQFSIHISGKLQLATSLPTDRCVPWLETAVPLAPPGGALVGYEGGVSTVRLCTNLTSSAIDQVLGAEYRYDPLSQSTDGACKLTDPATVAIAAAQCVGIDGTNCAAALAEGPAPFGPVWNHAFSGLQNTAPCSVGIRRLSPSFPNCTQPMVWTYRKQNAPVVWLFTAALVLSVLKAIFEFVGLYRYGEKREVDFFYSVAQHGTLGAVHMAYVVLIKKQPSPPERDFTWQEWFFVQGTDLVSSVAMPIVALLGCSFGANKQLIVLAALGITRAVGMTGYEIYKRTCGASASGAASSDGAGSKQVEVLVVNPVAKSTGV